MTPQLTYYNLSKRVTAFSTTRHGGFSLGNYAELNLNVYCGDDSEAVQKNRLGLAKLLGVGDELIIPHQVHGVEVRRIDTAFMQLSEAEKREQLEGVDAVMTDVMEVCIGVSTADCIPLLLYDSEHHCAAAVHAGWRGTVARIVEKTILAMKVAYGTDPQQLHAVIGPGISLKNFEVGQEVYDAFLKAGFSMEKIAGRYLISQRSSGRNDTLRDWKWHIDLPMCNRIQMELKGVPSENIFDSGVCTFDQSSLYFSARRLGIDSGRIYTGLVLR